MGVTKKPTRNAPPGQPYRDAARPRPVAEARSMGKRANVSKSGSGASRPDSKTYANGGKLAGTDKNSELQDKEQEARTAKHVELKRGHDEVEDISTATDLTQAKKAKTNSGKVPIEVHAIKSHDQANIEDNHELESTIAPALLGNLATSYEVSAMWIISSSQIENKVRRVLENLASFSFAAPTKPNIILLCAKSTTASKMISIVEISKREIAAKGGKWYQYNRLEHNLEEKKKEQVTTILGRQVELGNTEIEGQSEDESAFETMKTPLERAVEGRPKIRAIPVLTVYLSRVRVESLKNTYGYVTKYVILGASLTSSSREQTNDMSIRAT